MRHVFKLAGALPREEGEKGASHIPLHVTWMSAEVVPHEGQATLLAPGAHGPVTRSGRATLSKTRAAIFGESAEASNALGDSFTMSQKTDPLGENEKT